MMMHLSHLQCPKSFSPFNEKGVSSREQRGHDSAASLSVYQNENGGKPPGDVPLLTSSAKTILENT